MYAIFEHEFEIEHYLDFVIEKKYIIAITKVRLSSYDLAIDP